MRTTGLSESASDQVLNVLKERDYYIGIIILKREKDRELPIQSFPVILITSLFISFDFFPRYDDDDDRSSFPRYILLLSFINVHVC